MTSINPENADKVYANYSKKQLSNDSCLSIIVWESILLELTKQQELTIKSIVSLVIAFTRSVLN